jgi:hypothetical protein
MLNLLFGLRGRQIYSRASLAGRGKIMKRVTFALVY